MRIRQKPAESPPNDGFLRFACPCGRRLKVMAAAPPTSGKCPDCGRLVPVPDASQLSAKAPGHPEAPTTELNVVDRDVIDGWKALHRARNPEAFAQASAAKPVAPAAKPAHDAAPAEDRQEVGLRVCPSCGKPVHLGAEACRSCGTPVPRR